MIKSRVSGKRQCALRRGGAAVELAGILPILVFCTMASVDFARVAYVQVTLQNCARNGALYEFYLGAGFPMPTTWTTRSAAVSADAPSWLTVTSTASTPGSATNNTVTVTATATYNLIALGALKGMSSMPGSMTLSQTAKMPYPSGMTTVAP